MLCTVCRSFTASDGETALDRALAGKFGCITSESNTKASLCGPELVAEMYFLHSKYGKAIPGFLDHSIRTDPARQNTGATNQDTTVE